MIASAEQWIRELRASLPRWVRALHLLLDGESLTARSAARAYGEWNLAETMRELERQGLRLRRRPELTFATSGAIAPRLTVRYFLRPESRALAQELLSDRGVKP